MAQVQWNCNADSNLAYSIYGNGLDPHNVAGTESAESYEDRRCLLKFGYSKPGDFVSINWARLYWRGSTGSPPTGHDTPDPGKAVYIERVTSSWTEGTRGADHVYGSNNAVVWPGPSATTTGRATGSMPSQGSWNYADVTDIVSAWLSGSANYGVRVRTTDGLGDFCVDSRHTTNIPYILMDYTNNTAPLAPTNLSPTGSQVVGTAPTLSGTMNDPGDTMGSYQILIYADNGTTLVWNSGEIAASGQTSFSKASPTLTGNTYYKWQARTKDDSGVWGPYSSQQRFKTNTAPTAPTGLSPSGTTQTTLTPTISGTRADSDPGDTISYFQILLYESNGTTLKWDSGALAGSSTTFSKVYNGAALSWQSTYKWKARTQDSNGAWGSYSALQTFYTATAPAPTLTSPINSAEVTTLTPQLKGNFPAGYVGGTYDVEVYESNGTTLKWQSLNNSAAGASTFTKTYAGAALSWGTTYKWRARVTPTVGGTSAWTALQTFATQSAGAPTNMDPVGTEIGSLTPTMYFERSGTDLMQLYDIEVQTADGVTTKWSLTNQTTGFSPAAPNATSMSRTYGGTALAWDTQYRWRARYQDSFGAWGNWTSYQYFTTQGAEPPVNLSPNTLATKQDTLTPTLQGESPVAESFDAYEFIVYLSDGVTVHYSSPTRTQTAGTSFSRVYDGTALAWGTTYKWKARIRDTLGAWSAYSAMATFYVNANPNAPSPTAPEGPILTVTPTLYATFQDNDKATYGDTPAAHEIEVRRVSDENLMAGRITTDTNEYEDIVAGDNLALNVEYKWRMRYKDASGSGVYGPYSGYMFFKPTAAPTVTITGDLADNSTNVSNPTVSWTYAGSGGKTQATFRVQVWDDIDPPNGDKGSLVYDSGIQPGTDTSWQIPTGYLLNNEDYVIEVTCTDTDGIEG